MTTLSEQRQTSQDPITSEIGRLLREGAEGFEPAVKKKGEVPNRETPKVAEEVGDDDLAAGLSEETHDESEDSKATDGESCEKSVPMNVKELSERLGIDIEDVYKIAFNDSKGESHTIGELKDLLTQTEELTSRELEFEERRVKAENELLKTQNEYRAILSKLPKQALDPALIAQAQAEFEATAKAEFEKVKVTIPEWANDDVREKDLNSMADHLESYGFDRSVINTMIDHRMVKYVRDNMMRQNRIEKVLAKVKEKKAPAKATSAKPNPKLRKPSAGPLNSKQEQVASIAELLRG